VISADGDAASLRDPVLAAVKTKELKKPARCFISAGATSHAILPGELGERGFTVVTQTTYRMVRSAQPAARRACEAFAANRIGGGAALFAAQRARVSGYAARRRRRDIALAILQCCTPAVARGPRRRGDAGHGGGDAG
jgi:uroporphyrinogen-III synthase